MALTVSGRKCQHYSGSGQSRKGVGPDQWDAFEAQVRAMYTQMARIKITPLWAKLLDFQTRFPTPIEKLIRRAS
jgi:hypothetical protein